MSYINHQDLVRFAKDRVNMQEEDVKEYRGQVKRLREKLEDKIRESEDYDLLRMLLSGSLAKSTALRNLNDIDVAVYIKPSSVEDKKDSISDLLEWLAELLRGLYPNMDPSQITVQNSSVNISYSGSGLDVDVVPIIHSGDPEKPEKSEDADWDGDLRCGDAWLMTNIPRHVEFIRQRKRNNPDGKFRQIVRLLKYWSQQCKKENSDFRCKSFMIELIVAHLADKNQICMDDYVESLADFFNFIARDELDGVIAFSDHYDSSKIRDGSPIQIFDPANQQNNVASNYTAEDKKILVDECKKAADRVDSAMYAPTKGKAEEYWRKIFGPAF